MESKQIWGKVKLWLKQRRVWAAILSAIAAGSVAFGYLGLAQLCTIIAGGLGLHSYIKPK